MKYLIIGDIHFDDPYLLEQEKICKEILSYDADAVIQMGDYYNNHRPSPKTLDFGTEFAIKLKKKYNNVIVMAGNGRHDWLNNYNAIKYLRHLGVETVGMELIKEIDGKRCLFAHHMAYDSKLEYGTSKYTLKELKKFDIALLAHQHLCQDSKYYSHIGSIFYQTFGEVEDKNKRIAMIDGGELSFIPLKTPIPMMETNEINKLQKIPDLTKIKLNFTNFDTFKKNVKYFSEWKEKFYEFKYELECKKEKKKQKNQTKRSKFSLDEELNNIEDEEVKELLFSLFKTEEGFK